MNTNVDSFRVIQQDDHGEPVRCSGCPRAVKRVIAVSLARRPDLEERIVAADGDDLWVGLRAYCVLAMAKALALAEGKL